MQRAGIYPASQGTKLKFWKETQSSLKIGKLFKYALKINILGLNNIQKPKILTKEFLKIYRNNFVTSNNMQRAGIYPTNQGTKFKYGKKT